mmetsp:Transcript_8415/g.16312  ORF Transcript_8415/g.16312 Transcript_8415/m.16312 type:complete len:204 (+) Transcript_8415:653-1264(+)
MALLGGVERGVVLRESVLVQHFEMFVFRPHNRTANLEVDEAGAPAHHQLHLLHDPVQPLVRPTLELHQGSRAEIEVRSGEELLSDLLIMPPMTVLALHAQRLLDAALLPRPDDARLLFRVLQGDQRVVRAETLAVAAPEELYRLHVLRVGPDADGPPFLPAHAHQHRLTEVLDRDAVVVLLGSLLRPHAEVVLELLGLVLDPV